jgi:integrase
MSKLTDVKCKSAKLGEHADGDGLYLVVRPSARPNAPHRRSWMLRVVNHNGRRRWIGLGKYPDVGLSQARQKAQDARRALAEGNDPSQRAKAAQRLAEAARNMTLREAIERTPVPTFRNAKSLWIRSHCLNVIFAPLHDRDVSAITSVDIAAILKPLRPWTASRAFTAVRGVFKYAAAALRPHGVVIRTPVDAGELDALGWRRKSRNSSEHHPAVHWNQMPEVVDVLNALEGADAACTLFIIATGVRAGSARVAKWTNINPETRVWRVPRPDLKDGDRRKLSFAVPLSDLALQALEKAPPRSRSPYVFGDAPITDHMLVCLVRRLRRRHDDWRDPDSGRPFTIHGFRSSLRTWAQGHRLDREVAEMTLGHEVYRDAEGAYVRGNLLEERRALLDAWSRHCQGETAPRNVIPMTRIVK